MGSCKQNLHAQKGNIIYRAALMLAWLCGLILGIVCAFRVAADICCTIHSLARSQVSFFGMLCAAALPLLICAILFWFGRERWVVPVVALKAFSFGFCAQSIFIAYSGAGWLSRWMFMLSSSCSVVLLLLYCYRRPDKNRDIFVYHLFLYLVIIAVITCIDFYVVYPLSVTLY